MSDRFKIFLHLGGQGGSATDTIFDRVKSLGMFSGFPHNGDVHSRDAGETGGMIATDGVENIFRLEAGQEDHDRTSQDREVHANGQAVSMEEGADTERHLLALANAG